MKACEGVLPFVFNLDVGLGGGGHGQLEALTALSPQANNLWFKVLPRTGHEGPARSESQYRLSYPGPKESLVPVEYDNRWTSS
jgi:hypothetical protein